jgi:RNA ligase
MKIQRLLDVGLLADHVSAGLVSARFHETWPLVIYNYTPECQYSRAWDDVTTKTRGLIVNADTDEVVARPFEKFFNHDERHEPIPTGPALRMEKLDGSLGILYSYSGEWAIATRGSFHSEQAKEGTRLMREVMATGHFVPKIGKTYLFEIIY